MWPLWWQCGASWHLGWSDAMTLQCHPLCHHVTPPPAPAIIPWLLEWLRLRAIWRLGTCGRATRQSTCCLEHLGSAPLQTESPENPQSTAGGCTSQPLKFTPLNLSTFIPCHQSKFLQKMFSEIAFLCESTSLVFYFKNSVFFFFFYQLLTCSKHLEEHGPKLEIRVK